MVTMFAEWSGYLSLRTHRNGIVQRLMYFQTDISKRRAILARGYHVQAVIKQNLHLGHIGALPNPSLRFSSK